MSSYIRLEILLFFRAFETGVGMLVVYRLTDMLKRRLFCDRMWNSTVDTDRCTHYRSNRNIPERRGNHRGDFWRQPADTGRPD